MSFSATVLVPWLVDKLSGKGFDLLIKKLSRNEDDFNKRFRKAIIKVTARLQSIYPEVLANDIEYFFTTKEVVDELIKLLFQNSKINIDNIYSFFDTETLPKNFIYELVNDLKKEILNDSKLREVFSNNEIHLTILGIGNNIEKITDHTFLSVEEITKIRILLQSQFDKNFDFDAFRKTYRESALSVISQVNFIGLGVKSHIKKNRKKLKDIFIEPKFGISNKEAFTIFNITSYDDNKSPLVLFEQLFTFPKNMVILGDPGSGKSMAVKRIMCAILENDMKLIPTQEMQDSLPFRIELRKYLQFKKEKNKGIINYLSSLMETDYGVSNLTYKNINHILNTGHLLFFFDGLDEVFNIADKIDIKSDIENFIKSHDNIIAVVTSRVIGYDEAKLDESSFCELRIKNFDEEQIKNYVTKWYSQEEIDDEIRVKEVNEFLNKKHQIDQELIRNPLLLSLIVILFRNNLKLPESKLEIYQSCTKTLVEKWDATKDLRIEISDDLNKKKESLFADLAYWQYEQLSSKTINITNERAIAHLAEVIVNKHKLTDDYIQGRKLSDDFLSYALKRSLYFDNNFTHKTFLEYFTAYWIYSNIEKKHKTQARNDIISKYIANPFWAIVLELLFNMIDQDQADTEIIDNIFQQQFDKDKASLPFLISILPTLKNIGDKVKEDLFYESFDVITLCEIKPQRFDTMEKDLPIKIFEVIDIDDYVLAIAEKYFDKECNENERFLKFEIFFLELAVYNFNPMNSYEKSFLKTDKYYEAVKNNPYFFILDFYSSNSNSPYMEVVLKFINYFGADKIFSEYDGYFSQMRFGGVGTYYASNQIQLPNIVKLKDNYKILIKAGVDEAKLKSELISRHYYQPEIPISQIKILVNLINETNDFNDMFNRIYLTALWRVIHHTGVPKKEVLKLELNAEVMEIMQIKSYEKVVKKLKLPS